MATLAISLTGSAVVTGAKNYTVSDADVQKILDWAKVALNDYIQATFNPTNTPGFVPTNQQIMLAWVQTWINGTKDAVRKSLQDSASATAISGVAPIAIT